MFNRAPLIKGLLRVREKGPLYKRLPSRIIFVGGDGMLCKRCSQNEATRDHLCDPCAKADQNRVSHFRQQNYDWVALAKESDLELWERQPGETDHEYHVWLRYRDAYPGKRPTYRMVAEEIDLSVEVTRKIGARWDFPVRLQAWAKYCDEITLAQRREEILNMNKKHVDMASVIHQKLQIALAKINPETLSVKDMVSLMRMSTDVERKAQLHEVVQGTIVDDSPEVKKGNIKSGDIDEVIKILAAAGQLKGVRQTVTTEVVTGE